MEKHTLENKRIKNQLIEIAVNSQPKADPDKQRRINQKYTEEQILLAQQYYQYQYGGGA